jgi:hypothetical protein
MAARTDTAWTVARSFTEIARYRRLTDQGVADAAGAPYTRSTVQDRRRGKTAIDANDIDAFARVLGIPSTVLFMPAADALRWVTENAPNVDDPPPNRASEQGTTQSG